MTIVAVLVLVPAYAVAASWAIGFGRTRLWVTAPTALVMVVLGAVVLGKFYAVPDPTRLLLAAVLLSGPIVLVPTVLLTKAASNPPERSHSLRLAMVGAVVGFACGWVMVVVGLRVW